MTIKCGCGFDSGLKPPSSYNVGRESKRLGMEFIMLADGEHTWICPACYARAKEAIRQVCSIVGSTFWSVSSFLKGNPK